LAYAYIPDRKATYAFKNVPRTDAFRLAPLTSRPFDIRRETQAIRGALFGMALSVPLWAVTIGLAYWAVR
jgi:hypothetical protein